jgi:pimeloyl-ACP methyl ester carboxylesterase
VADEFAPLFSQSVLSGYRLITYHRRGYGGSTKPYGPVTVAEQASDCLALTQHLGIERAHVVGHSQGAIIGLQLALDHPEAVHSLTLLETAATADVPSIQRFYEEVGIPAFQLYRAGDRAEAIDTLWRGIFGPNYRAAADRVLPGLFEQAVADADTLFGVDFPALQEWTFTSEDAQRITQPVLAVVGADSGSVFKGFQEMHDLMVAWLPQVEAFVLASATHMLQIMNPSGVAEALASFFVRHPCTTASPVNIAKV